MLVTVRNTLNSFSKKTKEVILKITMTTLLLLGVLFIYLSTNTQESSIPSQNSYNELLQQYQNKYSADQANYRQFVFYQTHDEIVFNKKQLDQRFKEGLNNFSSLSEPQFKQLYKIVTSIAKYKGYQEIAQFEDNYFYDWQPYLPPVKHMRDYDGSFIFAAVSSAEFQVNKQQVLYYRSLNQTLETGSNWITLSQQEIIDCCQTCIQKKRPEYVYKYILDNGLSRDSSYPYTSSIYRSTPGECKSKNTPRQFKIKQWFERSGCLALSQRLAKSPIVVHVDARAWREYQGGILNSCGSLRNHYALLVGRGIGYWKIRNSWGPLWGEHGHIRIKSGNTCGICGRSSYVGLQ